MGFRAVVFDIGGVLEFTPPMGMAEKWEDRLGSCRGELPERLGAVFAAGNVGALTEAEIHGHIGQILALGPAVVDAFMGDLWTEYLGTLNAELTTYFAGLRPAYRTGIISNSFVGRAGARAGALRLRAADRRDHLLPRGRDLQAGPADLRTGVRASRRASGGNDLPR